VVVLLQVSGQPRGAFPKPFNYTLDHMDGSEWDYDYDFQCYFLYQHRAELYHWIDYRCEQMLAGMPMHFVVRYSFCQHILQAWAMWLLFFHENADYLV